MIIRREIARRGDRVLTEVQLIGVSGQVCSRSYEVDGPEKLVFTSRQDAETAFADQSADVAA